MHATIFYHQLNFNNWKAGSCVHITALTQKHRQFVNLMLHLGLQKPADQCYRSAVFTRKIGKQTGDSSFQTHESETNHDDTDSTLQVENLRQKVK